MKFWVGVTDNNWFEFLSTKNFDEVNFWQPSAIPLFKKLHPGTPFLFKLKKPFNHIAGGGYFVKYSTLPISLAWDAFGEKNGANSINELERLIKPLASDQKNRISEIGCTILSSPFFFSPDEWLSAPADWSSNIVRGKTYDTLEQNGEILWNSIQDRLSLPEQAILSGIQESPAKYGEAFLTRARLGQGTFRILVTEAYGRKCAITGETTLPVLEAAHIKPFSKQGPNNTYNGLLLRSDFHKLFDLGYITITPAHHIEISPKIREEWYNGKAYYRLHGSKMAAMPSNSFDHPKQEYLKWHNEYVYLG